MNKAIKRTTAPLHCAILHTGDFDDLRATLQCMGEHAGYPHVLSMLNLSDDAESAHYIDALQQPGIIQNSITPTAPVAPAAALMQMLGTVDAPYALIVSTGTVFPQAGWLRRILNRLITAKIPALAAGPGEHIERRLAPVLNPNELSGHLCQHGHTILTTQSGLERLGIFTHRGLMREQLPHSAEIAARETRLMTLQAHH